MNFSFLVIKFKDVDIELWKYLILKESLFQANNFENEDWNYLWATVIMYVKAATETHNSVPKLDSLR